MVGAFFMLGEIWDFLCPFLRNEVSAMANRIMANRIMGITVEIGGDTTKLQTALQGLVIISISMPGKQMKQESCMKRILQK